MTAQTDAPERIWATHYYNLNRSEDVRAWSMTGFDNRKQQAYVRADLHDAAQAEIAKLRAENATLAGALRVNGLRWGASHANVDDVIAAARAATEAQP